MLRLNLFNYSDAYIVVRGTIDLLDLLSFKSNASFRSCISKINNTFITNAEDLGITIPMYSLLEYSGNYTMTSGSFWNCCMMKLIILTIMICMVNQLNIR